MDIGYWSNLIDPQLLKIANQALLKLTKQTLMVNVCTNKGEDTYMGAERWLQFERGELAKVRKYLQGVEYLAVSEEGECIWFDFKRSRLEIGYSFGASSSTMAAMACRELSKRFPVKKIGADSTGWYPDKDLQSYSEKEYGKKYTRWADWIVDYKPSFDRMYSILPDELNEIDAFVIGWFQSRDAYMETEVARVK